MEEFRCIRQTFGEGDDYTIINIGIDVHKRKCVATVKKDSSRHMPTRVQQV